ncbi:RNA polymerase [Mangrovactinospora gilvigrisea]|uniref:RNA polymerase n=1 Tax=Mangrovactinospora gilvigrisea TaxID=1428644 RepID=A0A1J7CD77_9ACTN|nr:RNA polymerase [Mangrovactinospora gilvigrisea]
MFRTAYVLTGNQHAAEDLLQETLVRVCRHWRKVRRADAPEAYARRIVVNLANDRWRRLVRTAETGDLAEIERRPDPRDAYGAVDLRAELIQALHRLPMGMRTVVVLHFLHDMDDAQIAQMLGISASAVRSQLARGLEKLRATLPSSLPEGAQ